MRRFLNFLAAGLLLGSAVAGCSTPGKRARQHPDAFHRLSESDQKLVLHGHVRPGLSADGVYVAWGEPDQKTSECAYKSSPGEETWIYRQRVSLYNPMSFYDHFGPYHGYGDVPAGRRFHPGYAVGGIGDEGLLDYRPNVRSMDTLRIAVFSDGKIDRCKDARGTWKEAPHATAAATPAAAMRVPAAVKSIKATHHKPHGELHKAKKSKKVVRKSVKATTQHDSSHHGDGHTNHAHGAHGGDGHHPSAKKHPRTHSGEHRR